MATRINLLLGMILVACALSLINAQYQARSLFIELERSQALAKQYDLQWTQLKLDQSTFGKHSRIEAVAEKELNMTTLTPDRTQYLTAEAIK